MVELPLRRPRVAHALVVGLILGLSALGWSASGGLAAGAGPRDRPVPGDLNSDGTAKVVFVGDSIMEGAAAEIAAAMRAAGYEPVVDTAVSRSTLAGEEIVRLYAATGPDAIVVMLGANDAGNPDTFRERVRAVVGAAQGVPLLMWMTIPEVRDYYPAGNDIIGQELAARPGGVVLDWADVAAGQGVTSGDGLHLTAGGKETMTRFVVPQVVAALDASRRPAAGGPAGASSTAPAEDGSPEPSSPGASASATGGDPGSASRGGASPNGGTAGEDGSGGEKVGVADSANSFLGRTSVFMALLFVAGALGCAGVGVALWSLWSTRSGDGLENQT